VSRTRDHDRVHRFAPLRIGHAEDGGFQDGRVLVEDLFDLGAVHVLAAGDAHVVGAVDQEQVALVVQVAEVPAVIPPMTEDRSGRLGLVPVTRHDVGAAHDDLADLPRRHFLVALVEDPARG